MYGGPKINMSLVFEYLSKKTKCLVTFWVGSTPAAKIDCFEEGITNVASTRYPATLFIGNIVFHSGERIDL